MSQLKADKFFAVHPNRPSHLQLLLLLLLLLLLTAGTVRHSDLLLLLLSGGGQRLDCWRRQR